MVLAMVVTIIILILVLLIPGDFASFNFPNFVELILIIIMGFSYFAGFFSFAKGSEINKNELTY